MKLYHDSRSLDCRAPFGAVRCGDIVRLRVYCQGRPRAVNAVITLNNQPYTIPLQPDGRDGYELRFAAPATPRLLWYYFAAVMENGQTEYLGNARDGLGGVGECFGAPVLSADRVRAGLCAPRLPARGRHVSDFPRPLLPQPRAAVYA